MKKNVEEKMVHRQIEHVSIHSAARDWKKKNTKNKQMQ